MAQYVVTHACTHAKEVQLYGPEKERARKKAWLATQMCPDCKRVQEIREVDAWTAAHGLIALQGSEKQVQWANRLRKEILEDVEKYVDPTSSDPLIGYILRVHAFVLKQSQASWWIDQQGHTGRSLLQQMVKQLQEGTDVQ